MLGMRIRGTRGRKIKLARGKNSKEGSKKKGGRKKGVWEGKAEKEKVSRPKGMAAQTGNRRAYHQISKKGTGEILAI